MSIDKDLLKQVDDLRTQMGFAGRSEVLRAGIRMLIADSREKEKLVGRLSSVLLLIHDQRVENVVTEVKHRFEDVINTHVHNHLKRGKCLEIFVLEGEASRIRRFVREFQVSGKMDYIKLIIA